MIDTLNPSISHLPEMEKLLVKDIHLLGTLLGETIREQQGVRTFETIETIRRLSTAFELEADSEAGRELDRLLGWLNPEEAVQVARAFCVTLSRDAWIDLIQDGEAGASQRRRSTQTAAMPARACESAWSLAR